MPKKIAKGFTLIELVIVIVLLGILAVISAPKFIDIAAESRISVLNSIAGNMSSAATLVNSKAIIQNVPNEGSDAQRAVSTNLGLIDTWYRYPEAKAETGNALGIVQLISLDDNGITAFAEQNVGSSNCHRIKVGYDELACYVEYTQACVNNSQPEIKIVQTNC